MKAITPHNRPTLGELEEQASLKVLRSGWLAQGLEVEQFENEICKYLGLPSGHSVAVSSGTAALFLALHILEVRGKRVVFPVYACAALRHAVALAGGQEVLVDISTDERSPNLGFQQVMRSNPDFALVPHMYGIPATSVPELKQEQVDLIEDACQALGGKLEDESLGLIGKLGIFSFSATKLMTSGGQGGAIVSKNRSLIDAIRDFREFDGRSDWKSRFNFQMTDLQAAIGRVQLARLPEFLKKREEIYQLYRTAGLPLLAEENGNQISLAVRYRAIIQLAHPEKLIQKLLEEGIKSINPLEQWELLGPPERYPNAVKLCRTTVSLPIYPTLALDEASRIAEVVKLFLRKT